MQSWALFKSGGLRRLPVGPYFVVLIEPPPIATAVCVTPDSCPVDEQGRAAKTYDGYCLIIPF